MATNSSSIDGLVSGMNTTDVINQLMAIERAPQQRLQLKQSELSVTAAAWSEVETKANSLHTAMIGLMRPEALDALSATSSNSDAVQAKVSGSAQVGSLTLRVDQLATASQLKTLSFASATDLVDAKGTGTATVSRGLANVGASKAVAENGLAAGSYSLKVTSIDGANATVVFDGKESIVSNVAGTMVLTGEHGSVALTVGAALQVGEATISVARTAAGATLGDLSSAISKVGGPASAQVVDAGDTSGARLVLTAKDTGKANELSASFTGFSAGFTGGDGDVSILNEAKDASISLGSGNGTITVTRASNTVNDVVAGITLNLAKAGPDDITVSVSRDDSAIVAKVKSLVDGVNDVLSTVKKYNSYDTKTNQSGALFGQSSTSSFLSSVSSAMSSFSPDGTYKSLAELGVVTKTDGTYELDETRLKKALSTDLSSVQRVIGRAIGAASDSRLSLLSASDDTAPGTYAVKVTRAAEQAEAQSSNLPPSLTAAESITITMGSVTATYSAGAGATGDTIANGLNAMFADKHLGLKATVEPNGSASNLVVRTIDYGSKIAFSISSMADGGQPAALFGTSPQTKAGVDVEGYIGDTKFAGTGQALTATSGPAKGLSLRVTATKAEVPAGGSLDLQQVTYSPGIAGRLSRVVGLATSEGGVIDTVKKGLDTSSRSLQTQIDGYEERLQLREANLKRQFSDLEVTLGQLRDQSNWLAGQIASLSHG